MALAERLWNARLGDDIIDHHTYAIAGDGCLMEGISQEAITLAGHLGLGRLIVLFDDNGISIDGPTSLSTSEDQIGRFKAAGWNTIAIDGHDPKAIRAALDKARGRHVEAVADRVQDDHRLRRAEEAGHGGDARLAARRRRDQGRAREARLAACAVRDPGRCARGVAAGGARAVRRSARRGRSAGARSTPRRARRSSIRRKAAAPAVAAAIAEMKKAAAAEKAEKATRVWSELTLEQADSACSRR